MHRISSPLFALLSFGTAGFFCAACSTSDVGTSRARLVATDGGAGASRDVRVRARDDSQSKVVFEHELHVSAGSAAVFDVDVPAGDYTFEVDVFESGALVASGSAGAALDAGATTEVHVDGGAASGGEVAIDFDVAPVVGTVTIAEAGAGSATLKAAVSDADGDELHFFWSGTGIEGTLEGSSEVMLSTGGMSAEQDVDLVLVVVDSRGASSSSKIHVWFDAEGALDAEAGAVATAEECLESNASCNATCEITLPVPTLGCAADCGLDLASCQGG